MDEPAAKLLTTALNVSESWARRILQTSLDRRSIAISDDQINLAVAEVVALVSQELQALLATDPEQQSTNPLAVFRRATAPITALLTERCLPPVTRDEFEQRSFPDDIYGLCPATWSDISPDLVEPGLEWGAWKAAVIISLHRSTNQEPDQSARLKT